jgi:hypothetical protein
MADSLEVVLHLAQLGHDGDGVGLAGGLLDLRVLGPRVSRLASRTLTAGVPYLGPHEDVVLLLVANGELALRLLIVLGERREGLDGLARENRDAELGVGRGVLVAGLGRGSVRRGRRESRSRDSRKRACRWGERQGSRSAPCASPRRCLRRTCRSLARGVQPVSHNHKTRGSPACSPP